MSDGHLNGDTSPRGLKNAYAVMRGEVRKLKQQVRRGRIALPPGVSLEKLPRQLCIACTRVFDFAMLPAGSLPTHSVCSDCKKNLANGFTIFVCAGQTPIMAKSPVLKADGVAGKITRVSKEDYDKLMAKFKPKENDVPGQEPT